MEKPNRRRLPMLDWHTAETLKPDFENQLAANVFFTLHSFLKHDCICQSHGVTISDEWSRLPSNSFIVAQCTMIAKSSINHVPEAIASGWIQSPIVELSGKQHPLVEPTAAAYVNNLHQKQNFIPNPEDVQSLKVMEEEIESSQSETWDSVIDEIENAPGVIVNCVKKRHCCSFP